jgi:hypothetical protein
MLTARNDDALRRSATAPLNTCNKTKQDAEQLQLLAIFHYIVAGLAVLFSFFPLLYAAVGTIFIFVARHGSPKPGEELPPEFLGWIFAVVASLLFLLGIAIAICILIVGCSLAKHRHYWFAFAIACVECLFIPFGTILGVFTIIVLSREPVKALFGSNANVSLKIARPCVRCHGGKCVRCGRDLTSMRWTARTTALLQQSI